MGLSRSNRIILLLIIDVIFFFVELVVGYTVGSLALVADSFHMLNDVMSLVVALYAIRLTGKTKTDARYSYGWHRAEILGALVNGVFLLALCLSIFLEAMERFFSKPVVGNPKLVVIVGACGLASNIVGLFLFHEHGHSHDNHDQPSPPPQRINADSYAKIQSPERRASIADSQTTPRADPDSTSSTFGHPAALRASFSQAAEEMRRVRSPSLTSHGSARHTSQVSIDRIQEESRGRVSFSAEEPITPPAPVPHKHASSGHSHSHGSMNMKAILLHVMGDALGNVGVIATGLIIWFTHWSFKYYFDPIISLVITVIIFSSALPLVRSTSFILLQGVPSTISLEEVREAILQVRGVISLHELHIWQLSENKVIASVHITASRDHDFMPIAAEIQEALHHRGIHSSTIQPEYTEGARSGSVPRGNGCTISCPQDTLCSSDNTCCPAPLIVV